MVVVVVTRETATTKGRVVELAVDHAENENIIIFQEATVKRCNLPLMDFRKAHYLQEATVKRCRSICVKYFDESAESFQMIIRTVSTIELLLE